jgi:hypothetical protein
VRKAPLAAGSVCLMLAAAVTLHASYWSTSQLAIGGPLGFGYYNATALQHGTGFLHIAYADGDNDDVLLRWWNGTAWQLQTVDAGRDVARGIDLAFTSGNEPAVSYAGGALKFAERSGNTWSSKTIESSARNDITSLEFSGGEPAISYYVATSQKKGPAVATLKLARRSGTTWTKTSVGLGARYSSLAFDTLGNPAIAFAGDVNGDGFADSLRLARLVSGSWQVVTIDGVTSGAGAWARLGFDPATGRPWIVDSPSGIGAVRFWYQDAGGLWQAEQIGAGFRPALLVHNGVPIVSYVTPDGYGLMVATRAGGTWTGELAAGAGFGYIGQSSLAVPYGTGGEPAVAYCVEVYGINASRALWLASPIPY